MRKRDYYCGQLRASNEGETVVLQGWVQKVRNFGGCVFVDLRDREGVVQVVFNQENVSRELVDRASKLKQEYVVEIEGRVVSRGENVNPTLPTGQVEVLADKMEVLSVSAPVPFQIEDETNATEVTRLSYRYLDLRRRPLQRNLIFRSRVGKLVRDYFYNRGFIELETPFLTKSTPEGARDFLVPSRMGKGLFYALPQSPQLFKQLFMVSGFDRYFQIVRCFRDEDLRADRQPEFTQVDVEMSFVTPDDVMDVIDGLLMMLFKELNGVDLKKPDRMSYDEAMRKYGVDNPDVRFGMELVDLTDVLKSGGLNVVSKVIDSGGIALGMKLEMPSLSRKELEDFSLFVQSYGAKGVLWLRRGGDGRWSGSGKKLSADCLKRLEEIVGMKNGDVLLFLADSKQVAFTSMGRLRVRVGHMLGKVPEGAYRAVWVTNFPMFEWNEEEKKWNAMHHPFTMPEDGFIDKYKKGREGIQSIRALSYDIVINGIEVGGGSIRIHRREVQEKVFELLGIGREEAEQKFGFLLEALNYGAPPHGGIALGFDRLVALLLGLDNIRDVIAFPKTTRGACLLTRSPSPVSGRQLKELGIKVEG